MKPQHKLIEATNLSLIFFIRHCHRALCSEGVLISLFSVMSNTTFGLGIETNV